MDTVSKRKRSLIMSRVKSHGNISTEGSLIEIFKELGIVGWRRNNRLPGSPDFVFKQHGVAVFADGCFWHSHKCRNATPKTNSVFWKKKLLANKARDLRVNKKLRGMGWHVFRIWECAIAKKRLPSALIQLVKCK